MPEQTTSYPAQYRPSRCPKVCAEALFDRLQHHVARVGAGYSGIGDRGPGDDLTVEGVDNEG